jgi:BRCT domain type II-containing protein
MANSFENKTFLFTGKLVHMKREEAEAKVAALGGKAVSGVSKNLSVLVATSETSAKWTKAQELNSKGANIQLWTEEQFIAELEKAESSNDGKAEENKPVADNAEEAKTQSKAGSKAKPKKSVAKCSKFEGMRPFIIEIETLKDNVKFECKINSENCKPEDIEYEVLCSDSEKEEYKLFQGDKAFTHSFKQQGKYKISFRGNLPGLFIRDKKNISFN